MQDNFNDDVFDMEDDNRYNNRTLTPADLASVTAPSPTGYRDYKAPAELLNSGYQSHISRNPDSNRSSPRRDLGLRDDAETHKVKKKKIINYTKI